MNEGKNIYLVVMDGKKERIADDVPLFKADAIVAHTFEEVEQRIAEKIRDEYEDFEEWDNCGWEEITIYKIESQHSVDIQKYISEEKAGREREKARAQEAKERSEYERLKWKYEGKHE